MGLNINVMGQDEWGDTTIFYGFYSAVLAVKTVGEKHNLLRHLNLELSMEDRSHETNIEINKPRIAQEVSLQK